MLMLICAQTLPVETLGPIRNSGEHKQASCVACSVVPLGWQHRHLDLLASLALNTTLNCVAYSSQIRSMQRMAFALGANRTKSSA